MKTKKPATTTKLSDAAVLSFIRHLGPKVAVSTAPIRWTNACRSAVDRGTESSGGSSLGSGPCIHHAAEVMRTGDL